MEREPSREALQRPGSQTHQVHPIPLDSEEFNKVPNVQGLHVIKARSCVIYISSPSSMLYPPPPPIYIFHERH